MDYYNYTPSTAAAIIFLLLFGGTTGYHIWLLIRNRTWFFITFVIGGLFEVIGYAARTISATQNPAYTLLPFLIQTLLILLAPSLFAASIYMLLGRIIHLTDGDSRSIIRVRFLTIIFVCGDIVSFLVQVGGGGILSGAKSASQLSLGQKIIITGLVVQVVFFGLFVIVACVFHRRITARPTSTSLALTVPWKQYLNVLYVASGLVLVRCLYRVVEYADSSEAFKTNEAYVYVFDAVLMWIIEVVYVVYHPSRILAVQGKGEGDAVHLYTGM
ncbi:RTA1 like protein [Aspergillus sclerotiicarbonarius CBS 121057]|uniref:RTA1 like protein n=1 Tax=Aspergillus sclerotiicarbonarius (strain CBS 121057 / IBT 28362) TaxID=1448318 RepID=A0A319EFT1_ASPSB|nr:RTA1 like protein [Aspergillus sclerotiicarbonarius CBS 121057]